MDVCGADDGGRAIPGAVSAGVTRPGLEAFEADATMGLLGAVLELAPGETTDDAGRSPDSLGSAAPEQPSTVDVPSTTPQSPHCEYILLM
jgi:hypothetical protein